MISTFRAFLILLLAAFIVATTADAHAVEFQFDDAGGLPAYGYASTGKPKPDTRYLLVIGIHPNEASDGQGAGGAAKLANEFPDVIVLGPTFASPLTLARKAERPVQTEDYFQSAGPVHEQKVTALIEQVGKVWPIYPKVVLH